MDIMVQGEGRKFYKPNEVEISINFYANDVSYEKTLEKGTECVEKFIKEVLAMLNINKEELKTRNFRIFQNKKYDYLEKREIDCGFDYNQSATLKMNYNMELISDFMEKVTKLENPPKYTMNFNIKEKEEAKKEVMAEAYNKAKEKAEIIATSAGKKLKDCIKVDFRPFEERVISNSRLGDSDLSALFEEESAIGTVNKKAMQSTKDVIQNIFTPEDVEIKETLYCLWITE